MDQLRYNVLHRLKNWSTNKLALFEWITQAASLKEMDGLRLVYLRAAISTGILPIGTLNDLVLA